VARVKPIVMLVVAAAAASIAAAAPALADNNNNGSCQFSAGMGPNSACANAPQDDYSDFVWPNTPGFAPGAFGPGFGIGFGGF
jgi:hypothetical protein